MLLLLIDDKLFLPLNKDWQRLSSMLTSSQDCFLDFLCNTLKFSKDGNTLTQYFVFR